MNRAFFRNSALSAALAVWLLSAGCTCVPEMKQAPHDDHLMSAEPVAPAKEANQ